MNKSEVLRVLQEVSEALRYIGEEVRPKEVNYPAYLDLHFKLEDLIKELKLRLELLEKLDGLIHEATKRLDRMAETVDKTLVILGGLQVAPEAPLSKD